MKNILLAVLVVLGTTIFATEKVTAQVNVNINIGNQPAWGPVGYDYAQYYYIPEYNIYYDVMTNRYIYMNNRRWIHNAMLPPHLRHINLFNTYKVVLNQHNPYRYNNRHMRDYGRYKNNRNQMVLRDNRRYQQHRPHKQPRYDQRRDHRHNQRPDRIAQNRRPNEHFRGRPQSNNGNHRPAARVGQRPQQHRQAEHRGVGNRGGAQHQRGGSNGQHERGSRR